MTNENEVPRKTVTYKAHLPLHPRDWTVETFRQFVRDADAQDIPGDTHVKRFPENDSWAFQMDQTFYYGLGVERVETVEDTVRAGCCERDKHADDVRLRIIIRYYDAQGCVQKFGALLPETVDGTEFCIDMREATKPNEVPVVEYRDSTPPCYGA